MMLLGYFLGNYTKLVDRDFANKLNKLVFSTSLAFQMFVNIAESDFETIWNGTAIIFCFVVTLLCILIMCLVSLLYKDGDSRGEFIQVGYRGSQALLGAALLSNIYGSTGKLGIILIGSVPLFNVAAVIILMLTKPGEDKKIDSAKLKKTLFGILRNEMLVATAIGIVFSAFRITMPVIISKAVHSVAATASPMGLLALGALTEPAKAAAKWKPAAVASAFKLVIFPGVFAPIAAFLGYRGEMFAAILIMLAAPSTVSCFTMARGMGHEGTLSSATVVLTTLLSAFTLTAWIFLFRSFGII